MPVATRRRCLKHLLLGLPRQLVYEIFSLAAAAVDTRTLIIRATRGLLCDQPFDDEIYGERRYQRRDQDRDDEEVVADEYKQYTERIRSAINCVVPRNAEAFDAFLARTVGMASLRGVSTAFRDFVDVIVLRERLAHFGVRHVDATMPATSEDYAQLKLNPQARTAICLRQGAPWAALADRVRAVVALMTAALGNDGYLLHNVVYCWEETKTKPLAWLHRQQRILRRAFRETAWTTPWVIDAEEIFIEKGAGFDANHPRCVALRNFAVSLAPPSSAGKIENLGSGHAEDVVELFSYKRAFPPLQVHFNHRPDPLVWTYDPQHSANPLTTERSLDRISSFCAFSFRPIDDDLSRRIGHRSGICGGYAVRVADLREPEGGSVESVRRWRQFWAEEADSDKDYDDDFDDDESYVNYGALFEDPMDDPPILLAKVEINLSGKAEAYLEFRFADDQTEVFESSSPLHARFGKLKVRGQIELEAGGLRHLNYGLNAQTPPWRT